MKCVVELNWFMLSLSAPWEVNRPDGAGKSRFPVVSTPNEFMLVSFMNWRAIY